MISHSGNGNFLTEHYDWIAAGVGLLALIGAAAFCFLGGDVEDEIAEVTGQIDGKNLSKADVPAVDLTAYASVTNVAQVKSRAAKISEKSGLFFSSEKRITCCNAACGKATPEKRDADKNLVCAFCGFTQEVAKVEQVLDADGDGLPDAWERKYGLNPQSAADAQADADGDGFTNFEEFQAKTDPTDKTSHPDYLDSLQLQLPLKETHLPFVFIAANKIPAGWRCTFFDAAQKDDYGRLGRTFTALPDEEIGKSGYVLKGFEQKEAKRAIKGGQGMTKRVDVSEATLERKSDGKKLTLVIAESKKQKPMAVDVQATLVYSRGAAKTFDVVAGDEIVLSGTKFKIREVKAVGKGAKVTLENAATNKKRTLEALER